MKFEKYANSFQAVPKLGLDRIKLLLKYMGNPQNFMKYIHVAGTNGKGSVCAFLYEAFIKEKITCGRFISPNMIKVNERVSVDGIDISDYDMNEILTSIKKLSPKIKEETGEYPSQFEIWTAMGFYYFKKKCCKVVILETGLGGRFDATNVIEDNILSIITKIDLDHTNYLGNTKGKIAFEKCGIIKCSKNGTGVVITSKSNEDVIDVIKEQADLKNNKFVVTEAYNDKSYDKIYETFDYKEMKNIVLSLGGFHQIENACIAIEALKLVGFGEETIRYALSHGENPGRLEMICENPITVFDGAHNPNGIMALKKSLDRYFHDKGIVFIMASMTDKDISTSLKILNDKNNEFLFVGVKDNERSRTQNQMREEAKKAGITGECFESIKEAYECAIKKEKIIVICGSLYLYKDFKEEVKIEK